MKLKASGMKTLEDLNGLGPSLVLMLVQGPQSDPNIFASWKQLNPPNPPVWLGLGEIPLVSCHGDGDKGPFREIFSTSHPEPP
jgi:hypothetical protein